MLGFRWRPVCAALAFSATMAAAPALTTIQDVLYMADGSFFNGVVTITWKSFEAADTSNIGAQATRLQISSGNLYVQLVPTTTASTPATYSVQYNSSGHTQFTETWVVPPSSVPLRVRDVRLAPGVVTTPGPPGTSTTVQISDVTGLQNALNLRPPMGTGYAASRVAVINALGAVDGAVGILTDCLHVDGTSGACGSASAPSGNLSFVDAEIPGGTVDGSNTTFTLANAPNPSSSLALYRNGLLQKSTLDFTVSTSTITFLTSAVPQAGDTLLASYRMGTGLTGIGFVDGETPSGAINGVNSVFTLAQTPNPIGSVAVYHNGVRLKSGADYTISGNSITFTGGLVPQTGDVLLCSYRIAQ